MKKIFYIFAILGMLSCNRKGENKSANLPRQDNIVEDVESGSTSSFRSGSYNDIVEALYLEVIKNDPTLKKLDEEFQNSIEKTADALKNEEEKLVKPQDYFEIIDNKIVALKDSSEKILLKKLVKDEFTLFKIQQKKWNEKQTEIDKNYKAINDAYFAFKVKKTLPEMKKYINQNPIKLENIDHSIQQQMSLLKKMKNLK